MYLGLVIVFFYHFGCVPKNTFSTDYIKYSALSTKKDSCKQNLLSEDECESIDEEFKELQEILPDPPPQLKIVFPKPPEPCDCKELPLNIISWSIYPDQQVIISEIGTGNVLMKLEASNKFVRDGRYRPKITLGEFSILKNKQLQLELLEENRSYITNVK